VSSRRERPLVWTSAADLPRTLTKAHTLLHQATRDHDDEGQLVATIDDYTIVRELVHDLFAEGLEATVDDTIRATVEAVSAGPEGTTTSSIAKTLNLDRSAISRRVQKAISLGYLRDLDEGKKGTAHRLVRGEPLPADTEILPAPERVVQLCTASERETHPPPPSALTPHPRRRPRPTGSLPHRWMSFAPSTADRSCRDQAPRTSTAPSRSPGRTPARLAADPRNPTSRNQLGVRRGHHRQG
jgi:hypothetical protein